MFRTSIYPKKNNVMFIEIGVKQRLLRPMNYRLATFVDPPVQSEDVDGIQH
jgi:hypothetical protein